MPDITFSKREEVYKKMKEHRGIRWTEVVRKAIVDYVYRLEEDKLEVTTEELLEGLGSEFEKDLSEISFKLRDYMRRQGRRNGRDFIRYRQFDQGLQEKKTANGLYYDSQCC